MNDETTANITQTEAVAAATLTDIVQNSDGSGSANFAGTAIVTTPTEAPAPIHVDGVSFEMGNQSFVENADVPAAIPPAPPVEPEGGIGLLGTVVADVGGWTRKILAAGEHDVVAAVDALIPTTWERAKALPLADASETLHEVEGLLIKSFRDTGDEIRKVYLNVHGMFVKA